MSRPALQWTLAIVITLASAVWQRTTGPTYPARGSVTLGGREIALKLARSHSTSERQPVTVRVPDDTRVTVRWRRFPTNEPWRTAPVTRNGNDWEARLPPAPEPLMPAAGKLEYQVALVRLDPVTSVSEQAVFPERPAFTRFKGDVPGALLVPHVFAMFFGMLFSTRTALAALFGGPTRLWGFLTVLLLVVGGFVLGPIVQKVAFGAYWTGVPWGWDLTDNKTLLAGAAWVAAAWQMRGGRQGRTAAVVAALVTLVVFAIPHSVWGSEVKWGG